MTVPVFHPAGFPTKLPGDGSPVAQRERVPCPPEPESAGHGFRIREEGARARACAEIVRFRPLRLNRS